MDPRFLRGTLAASLLLLALGAGAEECARPYPMNLPAEPPADEPGMLALQGQVKDYLAEANAYLECNESEQRRLAEGVEADGQVDEAEVQIQILLTRYNNTVDEMHVVGDRFNGLVRAWKELQDDPSY